MPSQHKHRPIPFRPPEGDRARLLAYAKRTGKPVNRILAEALAAYLDAAEQSTGNSNFTPDEVATAARAQMKADLLKLADEIRANSARQ